MNKYQWIQQKLSDASGALSIYAFEKLTNSVGDLWQQDHDSVLREIVETSRSARSEIQSSACRAHGGTRRISMMIRDHVPSLPSL